MGKKRKREVKGAFIRGRTIITVYSLQYVKDLASKGQINLFSPWIMEFWKNNML